MIYEQCPRCVGRGYLPEARKRKGPVFYARNCPRCLGGGSLGIPDGDYGYLQHGAGTAGPFRTERVPVRCESGDRWSARFESKWRRVHIQRNRTFIVYQGERITIRIEGV